MKTIRILGVLALALWCGAGELARAADTNASPEFLKWAERPPMGWNSWDCFGATVTEELTRTNADYMAAHLAAYGWQYVVVDIQWYEPQSKGWDYSRNPKPVIDEYGRLWPVVAKFPSSADGKGFKPLADYIHGRGLKFGLHLMRGIPREAVKRNTAILGSSAHATDIADKKSICQWNPDMYGVDMSKPDAQEYYDSVFKLLSSWGLDFVKVDDIARPYHQAEIEAIRKAIDRCGRPILLSLSPGATPLSEASHVVDHANLWRLEDDFWDNWPLLKQAFVTCNAWTPYRGPGHWPDPDMLPLGAVRVGPKMEHNRTRFNREEQRTLMTLWCISRAPLMFGGHLPWNDEFTLSLITNAEVLAVDQASAGNRQLFRTNDLIAWVAEVPDSHDRYLAFFNAEGKGIPFDESKALASSPIIRGWPGAQIATIETDISGAKKLYLVVSNGGDNNNWDHADWIEPKLSGSAGEKKLTDLKWNSATAGWGTAAVNRNVAGGDLMRDDRPVAWGIGTHAESVIEYDLPPGYTTFESRCALDPGSGGKGSVQFWVYSEKGLIPTADKATVGAALSELGFKGPVQVRDLWAHEDLGKFSGRFERSVPLHGAGLYRLSPAEDR